MSYILQFIKSARFMTGSSSNLVNNLFEGIHRIKCKYGHDDKLVELYISVANGFLNTQIIRIIECKCLCCNKTCQHTFD